MNHLIIPTFADDLLIAACIAKVQRSVYAASTTYGDHSAQAKVEKTIANRTAPTPLKNTSTSFIPMYLPAFTELLL